jgi:hypothetical protein
MFFDNNRGSNLIYHKTRNLSKLIKLIGLISQLNEYIEAEPRYDLRPTYEVGRRWDVLHPYYIKSNLS